MSVSRGDRMARPRRSSASRGAAALLLLGAVSCGRRADVGPVVVSAIGGAPSLPSLRRDGMSEGDRLLTDAVAEGLVRFDAAGQIEAGLAQRWIVTDGGKSYIFRVRDARWSNGETVAAEQIVRLFRRQAAQPARNPLRPYLSAIGSAVEMTPEVIEIELERPRPDLLKLFAQPELAMIRGTADGAGPFRVKSHAAHSWRLTPAPDPDRDPDDAGPTPEDDVLLIGERAARAIVRFVGRGSDLVAGGTIVDWPLLRTASPAPVNVRIDPAAGLFGLSIVRQEGMLSDPGVRTAIVAAFDRAALGAAVSPEWGMRETVLPEQLDSAAAPATPAWSTIPHEQRVADARRRVSAWAGDHGEPTLTIALPEGSGGTLLWGRLAADLYAMGVRPVRLALDAPEADLRLIDRVAPYDSARWYLAEACGSCSEETRAAIEEARVAPTLAVRAEAIARADASLARDAAFVPLGRPFRWSLVAQRLRAWQPNARAWHPLNRLRDAPN